MKELLTIYDIAKDLQVSTRAVQKIVKRGELPSISATRRGGYYYLVPFYAYLNWKKDKAIKKKENDLLTDFDFILKEQEKWLEECTSGTLNGKPMCESTVQKNKYFFNYYLKKLPRRYRRTPLISVNYLKYVFENISPKQFSLKDNMYKAVRSFIKHLIISGYCDQKLFDELRIMRPKRLFPPKKMHCTKEQFEELLKEASVRVRGQGNYDMIVNKAIVATLGLSGLRASELCNLRLQDVDLNNRSIFVYLGKGKKNRTIGICKRLYEYLAEYIQGRPTTDLENFFVTISRLNNKIAPFNRCTLNRKLYRLSKRVNFEVTPHALRRSFATIFAAAGKPINFLQLSLGHSDIQTTQGYLCTTQDDVVREMQGW